MITRRAAVMGAMAAAALPKGVCDCHTHIFGDPAQFPFAAARGYTPNPALPEELSAMHRSLGVERVVIVTPSVYGTDNAATLFGIQARGKTARGIAVIDERTTDREMLAMDRAGMRGIRLNLTNAGIADPAVTRERFEGAIARVRGMRGWHVQLNVGLGVLAALKPLVLESPVPVVFDHMCGASGAKTAAEQPGLEDLLEMLRSGRAYVKVTNRFLRTAPSEAVPLVADVLRVKPERLLWGTDWPHPDPAPGKKATEVSPFTKVDDAAMLKRLLGCIAEEGDRKLILVKNAARLYGF